MQNKNELYYPNLNFILNVIILSKCRVINTLFKFLIRERIKQFVCNS